MQNVAHSCVSERAGLCGECVAVCMSGLWLKQLCLRQVFREQAIDGETLPLLTEEHLLNTMGLKLGPALKIRSQVQAPQTRKCVCARVTEWICECLNGLFCL